jgi:hypothetical protein
MRSHRIIFLAAITCATGCMTDKKEVEAAKRSLYDADFAAIYAAALEATREIYPNLEDAPGRGSIKTAWHPVSLANNQDDLSSATSVPSSSRAGNQAGAGLPTRLSYKRYLIQFDVTVGGGRPWRVKVVGHAAEWDPGAALPTPLHGAARPTWLDGRTDALIAAIYKRIKPYAVPMKEPANDGPDDPKRSDPAAFKDVAPGAAKLLAALKDAVAGRDWAALRGHLADDVVWSLGGGTGVDGAMALWQADPEPLDAMSKLLATCAGDAKKATCPTTATPGTYQLTIEPRGDAWRITSFVRTE